MHDADGRQAETKRAGGELDCAWGQSAAVVTVRAVDAPRGALHSLIATATGQFDRWSSEFVAHEPGAPHAWMCVPPDASILPSYTIGLSDAAKDLVSAADFAIALEGSAKGAYAYAIRDSSGEPVGDGDCSSTGKSNLRHFRVANGRGPVSLPGSSTFRATDKFASQAWLCVPATGSVPTPHTGTGRDDVGGSISGDLITFPQPPGKQQNLVPG